MSEAQPGDRVVVTWVDITEEYDAEPDTFHPRVFDAPEGEFIGWRTAEVPVKGKRATYKVDFLLVGAGDRDVTTGKFRTTVAYPKETVLTLRVKRRRKETTHGTNHS